MLYVLLSLASLFVATHGFGCCIVHDTETPCSAASGCEWLASDDPLLTSGTSGGLYCVSTAWADCERGIFCPPPPPVPPVWSACVFEVCSNTESEFNVAFLIDESGSVGRTNYLTSLDFVENMVNNDINDISSISMLAFGSSNDRITHFTTNKTQVLADLTEERLNYNSGSTCMTNAIREAIREFTETPGISAEDKNVLILMTDGYANCASSSVLCAEKANLDAAGIEVYVAGISGGFSASRVECLVDNPGTNILTIPKFDAKLFQHLEAQLRQVVCPIVFYEDEKEQKELEFVVDSVSGSMSKHNEPDYNVMMTICGLIVLVIAGLVYMKRDSLCSKKKGYEPLLNEEKIDVYSSAI